jgi:hypothetical protein
MKETFNMIKRKSTAALVALTAVISMSAAACGSSDAPTDDVDIDVTVPGDETETEVTTPAAGSEAPISTDAALTTEPVTT